jgi:hypothetical protein
MDQRYALHAPTRRAQASYRARGGGPNHAGIVVIWVVVIIVVAWLLWPRVEVHTREYMPGPPPMERGFRAAQIRPPARSPTAADALQRGVSLVGLSVRWQGDRVGAA